MVVEATVALVVEEVKVTPTGTITVLVDTLADIQELEITAHLIPMGTTTLGLEAGVSRRQMSTRSNITFDYGDAPFSHSFSIYSKRRILLNRANSFCRYGGGSNGYSGGGSNGYSNGYGGSTNGYGGGSGFGGGAGGDKMSNLGANLKTQHWGKSCAIPALLPH